MSEGEPQAAAAPAPEPASAPAPSPSAWPVLSLHERRVLGVLVEKAKTTPDIYPLSLNALVTGCNQKSNRDPIPPLSNEDVEQALAGCQKHGLVVKITGGRVDHWRHTLYETWNVDKPELAVLAELLLRERQTEGELRARAARMEPFSDLEALRTVLKGLVERRLVVWLGEEGKRGSEVTHGFHEPADLGKLRSTAPAPAPVSEARPRASSSELAELRSQLTALQQGVDELKAGLAQVQEELRKRQA
jgi:hypothetical protein